ncbi:MAG TPA: TRIC cation channel family protein [Candidatus Baltobacteraceae bacterium]|nr:TRIC cation channel family protein [Candidatus Baltobacteraceae bacterium]
MTPLIFSQYGIWTFDTVGVISLIAAVTNAFNGALLARRPDHYKHFTVAGVIVLAYAGGIGGGIVRDVLVNKIPSPLVNPWYLIGCLAAAGLALVIDLYSAERFKDGLFQFMTAFSLPWYAIVGAQAALGAHLGYGAAVLIGIIATTAGRWIIDIACQVVPKQLVRGEFFILAAALTAAVYLVCDQVFAMNIMASTTIAFIVGFGFRLLSLALGWEEWEPWEPPQSQADEKSREVLGAELKAELAGTMTPKRR